MKNYSYANRGASLERLIRFACEIYQQKGLAFIKKLPTEFIPIRDGRGKLVSCKVEEKSPFDFMGRYKNIPIAIESKHTSTDSIRWDEVQEHQADYMDAFTEEPGTIGMVVISFGMKRFFAVPWQAYKVAYDARVRPGSSRTAPASVSVFGTTWDIPPKNSIRADEIPPEYEISGNDTHFGLHFLQNAMNYIRLP